MKQLILGKILLIVRLIAAGVFLYAGWQKLWAPQEFADGIAAYRILPPQLINVFALTLPPLELITGSLLLIGFQRRLAAFSALLMIAIFTMALASAIARGLTIDCGCFGAAPSTKYGLMFALLRDLVMGVALLILYLREIGAVQWSSAKVNV
jgi:uncharacterized membrane protein YphA (DoxX/SURF4 family)